MNKKFIILLVFGFLILNFFSIKNFSLNAYGNNFFEKKGYVDAEKNFSKAENIYGTYNEANSLYKQGKFSDATKKYFSILGNEKNFLDFNLNHNIGNSYYKIGEKSEKTGEKKAYREKSVEYYKNALNIKYDEETKKNLEFVLNKIKKLGEKNKKSEDEKGDKKNQNNSKNSDSKNGEKAGEKQKEGEKNSQKAGEKDKSLNKAQDEKTQDGEKEERDDEKNRKDEKNKKGNNGKSGEKGEEGKEGEKGKENSDGQTGNNKEDSGISQEQEQALKQYEKSLQNTQKQANDYFNKVYQENDSNDPFDSFFQNDPFFNNGSLNGGNKDEKDW